MRERLAQSRRRPFEAFGSGNVRPVTDEDFMLTFNTVPPPDQVKFFVKERRNRTHNYEGYVGRLHEPPPPKPAPKAPAPPPKARRPQSAAAPAAGGLL